jgi:septal ring factor EnvC (AmiA/AmiB activator)
MNLWQFRRNKPDGKSRLYRNPLYSRPANLLCQLLLLITPWNQTLSETDTADKAAELESVRTRIKAIESRIMTARNDVDSLYRELQESEKTAAEVSRRLRQIEQQISDRVARLASLNQEQADTAKILKNERQYLAQQIRAAYKMGRNDYIKLLLNQEDPELMGRMLGYYDYYNRSRAVRISEIRNTLDELAKLELAIEDETHQLERLRTEQLVRLNEFTHARSARNNTLSKLEAFIDEQGKHLQILQQDELELASLINKLHDEKSVVQLYEDLTPFNSLQGKLKWPVKGAISGRFGELRKEGKLKRQGVTISAENGADVRAISPGKVIFADWFRNLGLLIILDHGDGYMSLYGHNGRLLKKAGDWVPENEIIGKVGDTGGQASTGLYFEIRQGGNPVNPGLWCKG